MEAFLESCGLAVQVYTLYPVASIGLHSERLTGVSSVSLYQLSCVLNAFPGLRSNILKLHFEGSATQKQRANVSALSGAIAGGGVTRLMGR